MHNLHIMIDIETLSTRSDAAIFAIGAVEFTLDRITREARWLIDPTTAVGYRDDSTLDWWADQVASEPLLKSLFKGLKRSSAVANELAEWIMPAFDAHWVWAGPSTFDLTILKTWYRTLGIAYPINWQNERDMSTLARVADQLGIEYKSAATALIEHDPLDDCIEQAHRTRTILNHLAHQFDTRTISFPDGSIPRV